MHRNRGFTLVEVMIVVAIIAILAAIAIPNFMTYRTQAHDHTCASNKNLICNACSSCLIQTGVLVTGSDLSPLAASASGRPPFLREDPHCPIGGAYVISYDGNKGFSVTCSKDGEGHSTDENQ